MKDTKFQLSLLLAAVGNVIDQTANVEHISYGEIKEWIEDILGGA